jgi:hypothetical protein
VGIDGAFDGDFMDQPHHFAAVLDGAAGRVEDQYKLARIGLKFFERFGEAIAHGVLDLAVPLENDAGRLLLHAKA